MKKVRVSKRYNRRAALLAFFVIGNIIGAAVTSTIFNVIASKREGSPAVATVYSTQGAESWAYTGNGLRYDESSHKLSYHDPDGAKHTVYTLGYIVEISERS